MLRSESRKRLRRRREREREREMGGNRRMNKNEGMVGLSVFIRVGLVNYPWNISLSQVYQGDPK
jgi:hypothetical protein